MPDGKRRGEHLKTAADAGSPLAVQELLGEVELPDCAAHVWEWFGELSSRRSSTGWGPAGLHDERIEAWMRMTGVRVRAHELEWIYAIDRAFLRHHHDAVKKADKARR